MSLPLGLFLREALLIWEFFSKPQRSPSINPWHAASEERSEVDAMRTCRAGYPLCFCRELEGRLRAMGSSVPGGVRPPVCPRHRRIVWSLKPRDTRGSRGAHLGTQRPRGDREHEFQARERRLPISETKIPARLDSSRCRSCRDGSFPPMDLLRGALSIRKGAAQRRLPEPRPSRTSGRRGGLTRTTLEP